MKVVIGGGSGLLGSALSLDLLRDGHEVVVLTRDASRHPRVDGVRQVEWHPPELGPWTAELVGADAVINLAGATIGRWPWTPARKRLLRESRIAATRTLVEGIASLPESERPAALLSSTGTDIYAGRDDTPADETTEPATTFLARLCIDWEAEALRAEPLGVRVVLMRTSPVHAPGALYLRTVTLPFRLFAGGRLGTGLQWVSGADNADVVGLYRLALANDRIRGPINVSAPDPRQQADYARAIGGALHRPSRVWTPAWVLRLVLGGQAGLVLESRRVWPTRALSLGYEFQRPRLEPSLTASLHQDRSDQGSRRSAATDT